MPFFIGTAVDIDAARADILETLQSYGGRTRAEMLAAARIIAYSMASLETLMEAQTADLSPAMKLRYRGCANGLNRATIQSEKVLAQSLTREPPAQPATTPEPVHDTPAEDVEGAIDHAQAILASHRARTVGARPATPSTLRDRDRQLWAGAMIDTLKEMGYGSPQSSPQATG